MRGLKTSWDSFSRNDLPVPENESHGDWRIIPKDCFSKVSTHNMFILPRSGVLRMMIGLIGVVADGWGCKI